MATQWSKETQAPPRDWINTDRSPTTNSFMLDLFGHPRVRKDYTQKYKSPNNPRLLKEIIWGVDVGFAPNAYGRVLKVSGLKPAVASLKEIIAAVRHNNPEVWAAMGTAGMLNCRLVRGSRKAISNHAWGSAIDLTFDGVIDRLGNGKTQAGLVAVYKTFHEHGWFWGAGFRREDSMHFEVSKEKLQEWYN